MNTMLIELAGRLLFIAVVVAAAFFDLRSRRIPNALTFPMTFIALGVNCAVLGLDGAGLWLTGLAAGAGLLLAPYMMGGIGAGDVKLLAMSGAMLGSFQVFCAFIAASVLGSLMAVAAGSSRQPSAVSRRTGKTSPCESGGLKAPPGIPYGLPLAAGVLLSAAGVWL